MRITRSEVIPIALPFRERYRTASGELDARSTAILRLETDEGVRGHGEAVPLSLRGGPGLDQVAAELAACGEALAQADLADLGPAQARRARARIAELLALCREGGAGPQALCAVDAGLLDLLGRAAGVPAWKLLGADVAEPVACNATLDAGSSEYAGAKARAQRESGFGTFKVKVGLGDDRDRVAAVRAAVGPEARVRIDANGAWSVEQALEMLDALADLRLELVEQPCAEASELAEVRARTDLPVVADESVSTFEEAEQVVSLGACDAATLKLSKVGGVLAAMRIAAVVPSYLSSALDGPLGIAAALHAAQALPREGFAIGLAHGLGTLEMFASTYAPHEGLYGPSLLPPDAPGLGVEVDAERLEELRIT